MYSELEVARYALKSSNLMLHPEFLSRLNALPLEYTYGEYRQLYNDYGTHFVKEATLGGTFDYTLVLNKEKLEKAGTLTTIQRFHKIVIYQAVVGACTQCMGIVFICRLHPQ